MDSQGNIYIRKALEDLQKIPNYKKPVFAIPDKKVKGLLKTNKVGRLAWLKKNNKKLIRVVEKL